MQVSLHGLMITLLNGVEQYSQTSNVLVGFRQARSGFITAVIFNHIYIYIYIYIYIVHFHLYHSVNIYSYWLQEPFCYLSLYTLYKLSEQ